MLKLEMNPSLPLTVMEGAAINLNSQKKSLSLSLLSRVSVQRKTYQRVSNFQIQLLEVRHLLERNLHHVFKSMKYLLRERFGES
jgi:hypothetical protein